MPVGPSSLRHLLVSGVRVVTRPHLKSLRRWPDSVPHLWFGPLPSKVASSPPGPARCQWKCGRHPFEWSWPKIRQTLAAPAAPRLPQPPAVFRLSPASWPYAATGRPPLAGAPKTIPECPHDGLIRLLSPQSVEEVGHFCLQHDQNVGRSLTLRTIILDSRRLKLSM